MIKVFVCLFILMLAFFRVIKVMISLGEVQSKTDSWNPSKDRDLNVFKKILKFKPIALVNFGVLIICTGLFSSIYITSEQQVGFVSIFGHNTLIENAGIHFKMPFVSEKHIFDGTTQGMPIGYTIENDESVIEDSLMITNDFNFINIDFYLEYRITDPIAYYYCTDDPEGLLKNIALSAVRNTVGQVSVDDAMTTGKSKIEADVFEDIIAELEKHNSGLIVTNISIQDSEAPTQTVKIAFQAVEDAKQGAQTKVNEANKYTNEQVPAAEANAAKIKASAEATKTERINQATEEVATFEALYEEYKKNPNVVKQRMYLDALSEVLPNMEIIIDKDGSQLVYVTGTGVTNFGVNTNSSNEEEQSNKDAVTE